MEIRRATLDELEDIVELFDDYRQWYHQSSDKSGARSFLAARLQNEESVIFLAIHDGKPVGFTQLYPIFSSVSMSNAWILNDMFVSMQARKLGVATALLNTAREFAKHEKAKWILLETDDTNTAAQRLYEKNDWKKKSQYFYELSL